MYPPDDPTRPCRPKAGQGLVMMMMMIMIKENGDLDDDTADIEKKQMFNSLNIVLQV